MIEIHVYGKLRRYAPDNAGVVRLEPGQDETLGKLLERIGIKVEDLHHIFLNSSLLCTRSGMASWLRYKQVRSDPFDWNMDIPVSDGDRVGLFGRDMAALVI